MAWDEHEHYYGFGEKAGRSRQAASIAWRSRNTDALGLFGATRYPRLLQALGVLYRLACRNDRLPTGYFTTTFNLGL
ncbi:MAG UNVERIFIED_CONTAM: hypothetical protein LVT10_05285 [Anaerolineae bacterium]